MPTLHTQKLALPISDPEVNLFRGHSVRTNGGINRNLTGEIGMEFRKEFSDNLKSRIIELVGN